MCSVILDVRNAFHSACDRLAMEEHKRKDILKHSVGLVLPEKNLKYSIELPEKGI